MKKIPKIFLSPGRKMERENLSEAKRAWLLWQLLQQLSDLLWDHYEEKFLDFVLEEDMDLYGESDKARPHP
jgi:hypothetical protein